MKYPTSVLVGSIAAALMAVSGVSGAGTMQLSHTHNRTVPVGFTHATNALLYDQTDGDTTNGAPFQDFAAADDIYDSVGADDFVVPSGGWTLSDVSLLSSYWFATTETLPVNIGFYPDAGGMPGATATCSYSGVPGSADGTAGVTTVVLPSPCALPAGTYWMTVQIALDFGGTPGGQAFWGTSNVLHGNEGLWQNPPDGFATGCATWNTIAACGVGGGGDPAYNAVDYLFQLHGNEGVTAPPPPSVPVPGVSSWSALAGAAVLALLALFGLRRRENHG